MRFDEFDSLLPQVRWVWFDLDDTLIDFHANSRAALRILYDIEVLHRFYPSAGEWIEAYEEHNHSLWDRYSRAEISQEFLRMDRFAHPLAHRWSGSSEALQDFSRRLDPLYLDLLAGQKSMVGGAVELLTMLRARDYKIGVLSNGFTDVQHKKLRNCRLDVLVDAVVLSDDIGVNKPDVRLYRHAMDKVGEPDPRRHLMIGDNASTDILGAVRAGWHSVLLSPSAAGLEMDGETLVTPSLTLLMSLKW